MERYLHMDTIPKLPTGESDEMAIHRAKVLEVVKNCVVSQEDL